MIAPDDWVVSPSLSGPMLLLSALHADNLWSYLVAGRKIFGREFLYIWSIKYKLITKLIIEIVCKLRDEFIKPS